MKKISIFMAAAAMCLSASAELYVTGENVEGATFAWDPSNPLEVKADGGVYSFRATGKFKISTNKSNSKNDWDTFNAACRTTGGAWVKDTNTATNTLTEGDADIITPKTGVLITYEVPEDLSTIKATLPDGETFGQEAPKDFYLVGEMNDWTTDDPAYKMSTTDGRTYTYEATSGISGQWKICDGSWNLSYGQGESSNSPLLNTPYNLGVNSRDNLESTFTQKVKITFNYVEGGQSTLLVEQVDAETPVDYSTWYVNVIGTFNEWKDNGVNPNEEGISEHEDLAIGKGEFKIKVWNSTKDVYFSTGSELPLNQWIKINGDVKANMTIAGAEADKHYKVKFNVKTHEIFVTLATGIETIDAEAADAVYYNLQGVRVDNPVKGLYIRVANGKSQKVMK